MEPSIFPKIAGNQPLFQDQSFPEKNQFLYASIKYFSTFKRAKIYVWQKNLNYYLIL